jgi:hypothetical protein
MLKSYLASKDIPFEVKMADEDQAIAEELYEKSGQLGVPFTIIAEEGKEDISSTINLKASCLVGVARFSLTDKVI